MVFTMGSAKSEDKLNIAPEPIKAAMRTSIHSDMTKISHTESLMFQEPEEPDEPLDNPETLQKLRALEMAVVFEDLVDALTAVSNAIPAPSTEIRTSDSILEDAYYNRPRYGGHLKKVMRHQSPVLPKTDFVRATTKPLLPPIQQESPFCDESELQSPSKSEISSRQFPSILEDPTSKGQVSGKNSKSQLGLKASIDRQAHRVQERQLARASTDQQYQGVREDHVGQWSGALDNGRRASLRSVGQGSRTSSFTPGLPGQDALGKLSVSKWAESASQLASSAVSMSRSAWADVEMGDETEAVMKGWLLKQFYTSKIGKRTWQANKDTPKRTLEDMVKNANLKKNNKHHKYQADIALIKLMMADIFNELVQHGTWESLQHHLNTEKEEQLRLSKSYKRLVDRRQYSRLLKAEINEVRMSKMKELDMLRMLEHQIEDESQEVKIRTEVEAVYTQNYVKAKMQESFKTSCKEPDRLEKEIERLTIWELIEERAHITMCEYLRLRLERVTKLWEYWIEKYETDKERLVTDLEELKDERVQTKEHRAKLEAKIKLWMPIIKDNRRIVKLEEDRESYRRKCSYYATKIAARWRGYMVRAGLGKFAYLHG